MRQQLFRLVLLCTLFTISGCGNGAHNDPADTVVWQQIDTTVEIQSDGTLSVTEMMTLRYPNEPVTAIERALPNLRLDSIANVTVGDRERIFRQVYDSDWNEPYTFSVEEDDDDAVLEVRWVFPEITGGERTFILRYDVIGAIGRYDQTDGLWWSFNFPERTQPIEQLSGRIQLPAPLPVEQVQASTPDVPGTVELTPGEVVAQAHDIAADQDFSIWVQFPKEAVGGDMSFWQRAYENQQERASPNYIIVALPMVLFLLLCVAAGRRNRPNHDPQPTIETDIEVTAPPDDLSPALAVILIEEYPVNEYIWLGMLVDLANRGYLSIHDRRGIWKPHRERVTIIRTDKSTDDLALTETQILDVLLDDASQVDLDKQKFAIRDAFDYFADQYVSALIKCGYFTPDRRKRRTSNNITGCMAFLGGLVALIVSMVLAGSFKWWLLIILLIVYFVGIGLSGLTTVHGVTQEGVDAKVLWQAFQTYLRKIQPDQTIPGQFHTFLPYAVAFDCTKQLVQAYSASAEPLPLWYHLQKATDTDPDQSAPNTQTPLLLRDYTEALLAMFKRAKKDLEPQESG